MKYKILIYLTRLASSLHDLLLTILSKEFERKVKKNLKHLELNSPTREL